MEESLPERLVTRLHLHTNDVSSESFSIYVYGNATLQAL